VLKGEKLFETEINCLNPGFKVEPVFQALLKLVKRWKQGGGGWGGGDEKME
jgi:hypothetical protein